MLVLTFYVLLRLGIFQYYNAYILGKRETSQIIVAGLLYWFLKKICVISSVYISYTIGSRYILVSKFFIYLRVAILCINMYQNTINCWPRRRRKTMCIVHFKTLKYRHVLDFAHFLSNHSLLFKSQTNLKINHYQFSGQPDVNREAMHQFCYHLLHEIEKLNYSTSHLTQVSSSLEIITSTSPSV